MVKRIHSGRKYLREPRKLAKCRRFIKGV